MSKQLQFHDKTPLSTPNPIHSSSLSDVPVKKQLEFLYDIPERDDSLGILSVKSGDVDFPMLRSSDVSRMAKKERDKARASLTNMQIKQGQLVGIPSPFLNKCNLPDSFSVFQPGHSESTISETDLLPDNSSTPRGSLLKGECDLKEIVNTLRNPSCDISDIMNKLHKSMDLEDDSFRSGMDAMAQLDKDEASWKSKEDLPVPIQDFSLSGTFNKLKMSMGGFFQERSDDPTDLFKTPQRVQEPPMAEVTSNLKQQKQTANKQSIALDDIQKFLASDQSTAAIDKLFHEKSSKKKEAIKENVSPDCPQDKSMSSLRSASSMTSLPNGKLPIASTKLELVFSCVKPGKSTTKELVIRNKSSSRVGLYCTVSNPAFRLNKENSEHTSSLKVVLHAYESKTLLVTFAPTSLGAAVDHINFVPTDPNHKQASKQFIKLSGYGGFGNLVFQEIIRDASGKFLLPLGNIDHTLKLEKVFSIKNCGSIPVFVHFHLITHRIQIFPGVEVTPKVAVLLPDVEKQITVKYLLEKKDLKYIKSKMINCVEEIGKIHVSYGTEVDRCRLRKICDKAKEKKQTIPPHLEKLIASFPGEVVPQDLKIFRDSISAMDEIQKNISDKEITITIEHDIDATIFETTQDDTALFQSLNEDTLDVMENTLSKELFVVEPSNIILTPPDKTRDRIILTNNSNKTSYFEVSASPEGLSIGPENGTVRGGETVFIDLECTQQITGKTTFKVRILIENERFDVDVKVVIVNQPQVGRKFTLVNRFL